MHLGGKPQEARVVYVQPPYNLRPVLTQSWLGSALQVLLLGIVSLSAACPFAEQQKTTGSLKMPVGHPKVLTAPSRKLLVRVIV